MAHAKNRTSRNEAAHASTEAPPRLSIERVAVRADRLSLLVRVSPASARYTSPAMAQRLATARPTLPHHTCINDFGDTFGSTIAHTPVPHALEHAIIDEQVRLSAAAGADDSATAPFVGTTEWLDETEGLARVEVSFHDDLLALEALRTATALLNDCLASCQGTGQMACFPPESMPSAPSPDMKHMIA